MRAPYLLLLFVFGVSIADERILDYHADILVRADGWIEVAETIVVRAAGNQVRRGIFRDYPVRYQDKFGNNVKVLYEPQSVLRDGSPENLRLDPRGRSVRTYFGSSERLLSPGDYTYTYRYDAGRMLGYFDELDELYWNLTGYEWSFPINSASASVSFEFDVPRNELVLTAYTGVFGADGMDYTAIIDESGTVQFRTTRELALAEGMTIAVGWPKGIVAEPGDLQKLKWLLADNLNLLIVLAGLIVMLGYYIPVWQSHGKDPVPGVIMARYEPPTGFSPASLRYINNMGYDNEVMTAGIVSLAVKGYLRISSGSGTHLLRQLDPAENAPAMATGERALYDALFQKSKSLALTDENYEIVGGSRKAHEKSLKRDYHKRFFRTNGLLNLPPVLVAIVSALVALIIAPSFAVFAVLGLMVLTIIAFAILMKKPTVPGRRLMDEAAGFREYLEIAEKDELNLRNPPEKTPELFEQYLPYALALGVDQQWAQRFARIFASLRGPNDDDWQPSWYTGSWNNFDMSSNTSSLSSGLGSAIGSSVSPPGSSSGSGGGGFSGGGGGGGGGGGW